MNLETAVTAPEMAVRWLGRDWSTTVVLLKCAVMLTLAVGMGHAESRKFKATKLLETAGTYYCFEAKAPDRILIGHSQERKARRPLVAGQTLQVSYDDEGIWVRRPGGGTLRLTQDYLTRAFVAGSACAQVVEGAWLRLNGPLKTLHIRGEATQSIPR